MATLFESPTMTLVLGLLSGAAGDGVSASAATRSLGTNLESTQRALHRLKAANVVASHRRGREVVFSLDRNSAAFQPVRSLGLEVGSLGAGLQRATTELGPHAVEVAFVYGSIAAGTDAAHSDMDLFIVGEASLHQLVPHFWEWTDRWGREVNPLVKTASSFARALADGRGFYRAVMDGPRIFVLGSANVLHSMVEVVAA